METAARDYLAYCRGAADLVVRHYSTSFTLASRVLAPAVRTGVRDVYAFVRLADEVVDGAVQDGAPAILDELGRDTVTAMERGFSTNPVLHAFAVTAREHGIGGELVQPFLDSMRADLTQRHHDETTLPRYIYGSAEVVGLMCLRIFLAELPAARQDDAYERLRPGAQALGSAFQKVNFVRDLAEDRDGLGRDYLAGMLPPEMRAQDGSLTHLTEASKRHVVADVRAELRTARPFVAQLPEGSRHGVAAAHALYTALVDELDAAPADVIDRERVSVPAQRKARVVAPHVAAAARRSAAGAAREVLADRLSRRTTA